MSNIELLRLIHNLIRLGTVDEALTASGKAMPIITLTRRESTPTAWLVTEVEHSLNE